MRNQLQKLTMGACLLVTASMLPMAAVFFLRTDSARKAILRSYSSVPFFAVCAACILLTAGVLFYIWLTNQKQYGTSGVLSLVPLAGIAAAGVLLICLKVIPPLQDLPYLNRPEEIHLEQADVVYNNMGDSPTVQIVGTDEDGERKVFSIDADTYKEGEALLEQTDGAVDADIRYLPHSGTVLQVEFRQEK